LLESLVGPKKETPTETEANDNVDSDRESEVDEGDANPDLNMELAGSDQVIDI